MSILSIKAANYAKFLKSIKGAKSLNDEQKKQLDKIIKEISTNPLIEDPLKSEGIKYSKDRNNLVVYDDGKNYNINYDLLLNPPRDIKKEEEALKNELSDEEQNNFITDTAINANTTEINSLPDELRDAVLARKVELLSKGELPSKTPTPSKTSTPTPTTTPSKTPSPSPLFSFPKQTMQWTPGTDANYATKLPNTEWVGRFNEEGIYDPKGKAQVVWTVDNDGNLHTAKRRNKWFPDTNPNFATGFPNTEWVGKFDGKEQVVWTVDNDGNVFDRNGNIVNTIYKDGRPVPTRTSTPQPTVDPKIVEATVDSELTDAEIEALKNIDPKLYNDIKSATSTATPTPTPQSKTPSTTSSPTATSTRTATTTPSASATPMQKQQEELNATLGISNSVTRTATPSSTPTKAYKPDKITTNNNLRFDSAKYIKDFKSQLGNNTATATATPTATPTATATPTPEPTTISAKDKYADLLKYFEENTPKEISDIKNEIEKQNRIIRENIVTDSDSEEEKRQKEKNIIRAKAIKLVQNEKISKFNNYRSRIVEAMEDPELLPSEKDSLARLRRNYAGIDARDQDYEINTLGDLLRQHPELKAGLSKFLEMADGNPNFKVNDIGGWKEVMQLLNYLQYYAALENNPPEVFPEHGEEESTLRDVARGETLNAIDANRRNRAKAEQLSTKLLDNINNQQDIITPRLDELLRAPTAKVNLTDAEKQALEAAKNERAMLLATRDPEMHSARINDLNNYINDLSDKREYSDYYLPFVEKLINRGHEKLVDDYKTKVFPSIFLQNADPSKLTSGFAKRLFQGSLDDLNKARLQQADNLRYNAMNSALDRYNQNRATTASNLFSGNSALNDNAVIQNNLANSLVGLFEEQAKAHLIDSGVYEAQIAADEARYAQRHRNRATNRDNRIRPPLSRQGFLNSSPDYSARQYIPQEVPMEYGRQDLLNNMRMSFLSPSSRRGGVNLGYAKGGKVTYADAKDKVVDNLDRLQNVISKKKASNPMVEYLLANDANARGYKDYGEGIYRSHGKAMEAMKNAEDFDLNSLNAQLEANKSLADILKDFESHELDKEYKRNAMISNIMRARNVGISKNKATPNKLMERDNEKALNEVLSNYEKANTQLGNLKQIGDLKGKRGYTQLGGNELYESLSTATDWLSGGNREARQAIRDIGNTFSLENAKALLGGAFTAGELELLRSTQPSNADSDDVIADKIARREPLLRSIVAQSHFLANSKNYGMSVTDARIALMNYKTALNDPMHEFTQQDELNILDEIENMQNNAYAQ